MALFDANRVGLGLHVALYSSPETGIWTMGNSISGSASSLGEVRHYAGGKRRAVTWGASNRSLNVSMMFNRLSDMETITGWLDQLVVVRSVRGEVAIGLLSAITTNSPATLDITYMGGSMSIMQTSDDGILEGERRR